LSQHLSVTNVFNTKGVLAYYEGMMSGLPRVMVGKLLVTPKYLAFHSYEIRSLGLFEKPRLVPTGRVLGLQVEKIVDVSVETHVRGKGSRPNWKDRNDFEKKAAGEKQLNARPRPLEASQRYKQLMITHETERGLEVAMFEVDDPEMIVEAIRNTRPKP